MNIQKIFEALEADEMNSALGIILGELENQGYVVYIDGKKISAEDVFDGKHNDIEKLASLNVMLKKNKETEQRFSIEFVEYHKCIFKTLQKLDKPEKNLTLIQNKGDVQ